MKKFYYPSNLSEKELFLNYWTMLDIVIMGGLLIINVLIFLATTVFTWFSLVVIYGFFTAKIKNGYSILKLIILYFRFLFVDQLFYIWGDKH